MPLRLVGQTYWYRYPNFLADGAAVSRCDVTSHVDQNSPIIDGNSFVHLSIDRPYHSYYGRIVIQGSAHWVRL